MANNIAAVAAEGGQYGLPLGRQAVRGVNGTAALIRYAYVRMFRSS
jgi:hypothetical protein